jgi:hypothetical protein
MAKKIQNLCTKGTKRRRRWMNYEKTIIQTGDGPSFIAELNGADVGQAFAAVEGEQEVVSSGRAADGSLLDLEVRPISSGGGDE